MTLPMITRPMRVRAMPACAIAAFEAWTARSVALRAFSVPGWFRTRCAGADDASFESLADFSEFVPSDRGGTSRRSGECVSRRCL